MPLYEYRCEACGAEEEAIESFSAPSEHACPSCGATQGMRRQLSKAGFVLSGGGWYASGYGAGKTEGKAAGDKAAPKAEPAPAASAGSAGCGGGCSCH